MKKITVLIIILSCLLFTTGVFYLSKVKIYEDILITYHPENNSLESIEIIGKSVFDKEVVLSKKPPSLIYLENYYLNNLTLILSDSVKTNNSLQLQINNKNLNIDLNKPDKSSNKRNYYKLNYATNACLITKIKYVFKCNYVNFSNIFKDNITSKINLFSIIIFIGVLLALLVLFFVKSLNNLKEGFSFFNILNLKKIKIIKFKKNTFKYSLYNIIVSMILCLFIIHLGIILLHYSQI